MIPVPTWAAMAVASAWNELHAAASPLLPLSVRLPKTLFQPSLKAADLHTACLDGVPDADTEQQKNEHIVAQVFVDYLLTMRKGVLSMESNMRAALKTKKLPSQLSKDRQLEKRLWNEKRTVAAEELRSLSLRLRRIRPLRPCTFGTQLNEFSRVSSAPSAQLRASSVIIALVPAGIGYHGRREKSMQEVYGKKMKSLMQNIAQDDGGLAKS